MLLDFEIADGGLVLVDSPGGGISLEPSVGTGAADFVWGGGGGPHVRSSRASLEVSTRLRAGPLGAE